MPQCPQKRAWRTRTKPTPFGMVMPSREARGICTSTVWSFTCGREGAAGRRSSWQSVARALRRGRGSGGCRGWWGRVRSARQHFKVLLLPVGDVQRAERRVEHRGVVLVPLAEGVDDVERALVGAVALAAGDLQGAVQALLLRVRGTRGGAGCEAGDERRDRDKSPGGRFGGGGGRGKRSPARAFQSRPPLA